MRDQKHGRRYEAVGRSSPTTRPCDGCHVAQSVVYCHSYAKCLCVSCDKQVRSTNQVASRHECVHVCEVCKSASTVLTCCADAPALCITCDAKVHSANTLAQRHQRVPVLPLPAAAIPAPSSFDEAKAFVITHGIKEEEEEVDSWLLLTEDSDYNNCTNSTATANNNSDKKMVFGDVDQYFDLSGSNPYYDNNITRNTEEQYRMKEQQAGWTHYQSQMPLNLSLRNRAAKILRYKEKRQARKFDKTIRYPTRKAYAEARPRINGRFAKISAVELKVDQMSSPPDLPNSSYGIGTVPWF